ncbi:helix-turn-helix domain-containing protein [Paenibacillus sp. D2_2]|uniref:helix-turn-helix domain-containing protein n=1 Tax=Paenibacillus sp. D2_2 TaxID=3073092 RepID=UPI0028163A6D|nr:helix-turn-helix domain-containing protein [Paenibacillus sp. D2_2]WMT40862.1 helix-turn-helix domain-containing protein [Paenibacillus sp. D2_2]
MKRFSVKRNIRLKLVLAACLLSILPVLIVSIGSYQIASTSLQQEVGRAKRETLKQVQQRIDDKLVALNKTILQHLFNPSLDEFLKLDDPYKDLRLYKEAVAILNSIEVLVDNVDSAELYFMKEDKILSVNNGLNSAENMDPELKARLQGHHEPYFWIDRKTDSQMTRGGSQEVTYVREVPVQGDTPRGYIIVKLNDRAFFQIYSEMDREVNSEMLVLTASGNIFSDWNKSLLQDDLASYRFLLDIKVSGLQENGYTAKVDGQDMLINYWQSPYNGWKYVSVVPVKELTPLFIRIKQLTLLLCLTLIIGCLTAALMLSKHFYQLIKNILDLIRGKASRFPTSSGKQDEFSIIRHYVEMLHSVNDSLNDQIEESRPVLAAGFVQHVLTEAVPADELSEKFDYYDLPHISPYYTVMRVELDNIRGQTERDINLFVYAVKNIAEEVLGPCGTVIKMRADVVLLINHKPEEMTAVRKTEAFRLAEEIHTMVECVLNITATVGVGRCHEGFSNIRHSFKEATEALQYRLIAGSGKVIYVGQVEPDTERHPFTYPAELEQQIMLQVKLGNEQQLAMLLDKFGQGLKQQDGISTEHVRMAFMQLISRVLRELYELDPDGGPLLFTYSLYERVNGLRTMNQMIAWLKDEVFPIISRHIMYRRNDSNHKSIETVLHYIEQHYDDDLSQPMMAELAGMPASHFSHIFKEELGMTFSDYLIAYRMEKAKELLASTDMKVAEIAEKLRYNNSQNFIRVFKRIHGSTPGDFRASWMGRSSGTNKLASGQPTRLGKGSGTIE